MAFSFAGCTGLLEDDEDDEETDVDDENEDEAEVEDDELDEEGDDEPDDHTTYSSAAYGYEFQYPDSWEVDETYPQQVLIYGEGDAEIISSVYQYPPEISLDELATEAIANTQYAYDEFEERSREDVRIESGEDGRVIEWVYREGTVLYHAKFLLVVLDGIVFGLEVRTDEEAYDEEFDALTDEIHGSFSIIEPPEEPTLSVDELETYDNAEYGYSVDYPAIWTVYDDRPEDVLVSDDVGLNEMGIWVEPAGGVTLDEVVEVLLDEAETDPDFEILAEEPTTLDSGQDGHVLEARIVDGPLTIRGTYLVVVEDDLLYVVFVGAFEDVYDDEFEAVVDAIVDSFVVDNAGGQLQLSLKRTVDDPSPERRLLPSVLRRPATTVTTSELETSVRRWDTVSGGSVLGR